MTRFVTLTEAEKETLKELFKNHPKHRTRVRGHMLLLSDDGFKIDQIARIHQLGRDAVRQAYDRWEEKGIVGLFDEPKLGRPKILTEEEAKRGEQLLKEDPRSSKIAQSRLEAECGKSVSHSTFKRALKHMGLGWKRMRKSLQNKRDPEEFEQAKQELDKLQELEDEGILDLYFFDESGVCMTPVVPYGWQPADIRYELPSSRSERINILGFCNRQCDFHATTIVGSVTSSEVIAAFDKFCDTLTKMTVVVIDNASMHTSHAFNACLARWARRGLFIKRLPPYSPELNLIEIIWRFLKYQWLPLSAYRSFANLKHTLRSVLDDIGSKYVISFG